MGIWENYAILMPRLKFIFCVPELMITSTHDLWKHKTLWFWCRDFRLLCYVAATWDNEQDNWHPLPTYLLTCSLPKKNDIQENPCNCKDKRPTALFTPMYNILKGQFFPIFFYRIQNRGNKLSSAGISSEKLSSQIQCWLILVWLREAQLSYIILTQIRLAQRSSSLKFTID